ncbi:flagellar biosynthetic protein FliO [Arthrobacter sp. KBS0702]|uniref:flagellar biosynthetic protein FliO n=1 Tax=Arthrobacter sp. KBS0702 TaxID=2578107 RepID=UPI00110F696E|nr:flagellar biosynthetic protein FliO [Arthrobacter sp. KBS0702]QDW28898.1 flagellar biosynthetic protein FliO [Arthrobacter sp. KBS0702]
MDSLILGLRVAVALGAVLGLIWLLQRRLGKGPGRRRADAALSVVSRQSLGQRASVVVVDAGGHRFLLGVTDHAVNVLHTGDIPEEAVEDLAPEPRRGGAAGAFAQILAGAAAAPRNDAEAPLPAGGQPTIGTTPELPLSRRSSIHRDSHARTGPGRSGLPSAAAHPPLQGSRLAGSILAGSTWKQAAAALRSGRRN